MSRESISNVDLALLRMDAPNNLMIITGLMIFEAPLSVAKLKNTIECTLLRHHRFRQRVVQPRLSLQRPYWEDDTDFDLDAHVESIDLPLPPDQTLLERLIGELMSIPLNPQRPLWKFYLVKHYGQGSALITRLHHTIADGIALMRVLLSMAETQPNTLLPEDCVEEGVLGKGDFSIKSKTPSPSTAPPKFMRGSSKFAHKIVQAGAQALKDPAGTAATTLQGANTAVAMGRFVTRWPDRKTVFKGKLGPKKLAVWSNPISLNEIKAIGRAFDATINDVLLATLAGALRSYLLHRGERVDQGDLHSFIPVNLRPPEKYDELGNQFGLVFLSLPIEVQDPIERLQILKQNMDELKSSPEAVATLGLFYLLGSAPRFQSFALSVFDSKGTAVTTNVPGPQQQLYLAGAPINTVMAWVPKSGHVGLGMSFISYNGKVMLGVTTDEGLVPDPERIISYFQQEFDALKNQADEWSNRQRKPIIPMLSRLDKALDALDEILDDSPGETDQAQQGQSKPHPNYCQGITKSGSQCKNKPLAGEDYCWVHH